MNFIRRIIQGGINLYVVFNFMTMKSTNYIILLIIVAIVASSCEQSKSPSNRVTTQRTEVEVLSLFVTSEKKEEFQLTFGAKRDTTLQLAMSVGDYEAQALAITLEKLKPTAPLPLDILQDAITKFGYSVKEVVIDSLINNIYRSKIICSRDDKTIDIIARPVDAATIALKFNAPIFISNNLLKH